MKAIVPVSELGTRVQEAGRIRLGDRGGKNRAPRALKTFRLTSPNEELIRLVAGLYGGEARPWNEPRANPPDQWEVTTKATELRVFLPPGALSCWYELWSGGGCIRRCDGRDCEVAQRSGDDSEMVSVPCLCKQENGMLCRPHTRLVVVLPELPFHGVWRCESKGWESSQTLPAMESLVASIQERGGGVIEATLALEMSSADQGRKRFVVPRLRLSASALELAAGQASVGALHSGRDGTLALPAGSEAADAGGVNVEVVAGVGGQVRDWYDADDEIVDAEVVEEDGGVPAPTPGDVPSSSSNVRDAIPAPRTGALSATETKFLLECAAAADFVPGTDSDFVRHALARKVSKGRTESSRGLSGAELSDGIELALSLSSETHSGKVTRRVPPTIKVEARLPV